MRGSGILLPVVVLREAELPMSLAQNGKCIHCDGSGCAEISTVPIALRPALPPSASMTAMPESWLFVVKGEASLHYCPKCARAYLATKLTKETI